MTAKQLQSLLRQAMRYIDATNRHRRRVFLDLSTMRIEPRSIALEIAKTDMLLAKMRRAVARPKTARKAK